MVGEVKNRILLVEDDADTRYALALLFELEGFEVLSAADGQEAYLMAMTEQPDLIVTDINMPKVSGLDLIRLLKSDGKLAGVPVVAMSAVERQQLNRAMDLGAIAVYQKPIEFDQFISIIANIISARRTRTRTHHGSEPRRAVARDRNRDKH
jgi:CheY-like chemotaxis protein